jgi:putative DNA primase/helicase
MQMGVGSQFLRNIHGPCPMCGGVDRWRFDNFNGTGRWWCNSCGRGDGTDLIMAFKGCNYVEAVKLVEGVIGGAPLSVKRESGEPDIGEQKNAMRLLWLRSLALTGEDIASRYLMARGIKLAAWPKFLRWAPGQPYWHDRGMLGYFPVLLAKIVAPDERGANLQRTYLREPGLKAEVPGDKARKMMAGPIPAGGAVRLAPEAPVMGVAEGVETALAAALIHQIPVWATLSTAGLLRFEPPKVCVKLVVFGDRDEKFGGQAGAYALAHKLGTRPDRSGGPLECEVRVPESGAADQPWLANKKDWNDVLSATRLSGPPPLRLVK